MQNDFRGWIRRHLNIVLSFGIGMTFGISVLALAYFSNKNHFVSKALNYGVTATGHVDLDEDLIWLFCGIVIGATVTCYAWWRDSSASGTGLEEEDVLNRLFLINRYIRPGGEKLFRKDSER